MLAYDLLRSLTACSAGPSNVNKSREIYPMALLKSFLRDETGATAIEYGLIAAGISVAIITVVNGLGTKLTDTFTNINSKLN
jgi:pilus assembly protein Flp/PilA